MSLALQEQNQIVNWTPQDEQLLIDTICKGATPSEFRLFKSICNRTQLCPFAKQIYPVFRWDSKLNRNSMTTQTGIDGLRLVAERTEKYAPGKASEYKFDEKGNLISATSFVKKYTKDGTWHEISYEAFYCEYVQKFKNKSTGQEEPTKFWRDMPRVMLSKVAEAASLRKCFPMELSGLYIKEEMDQADVIETVDLEEIKAKKPATIHKLPELSLQSETLQIEQKVSSEQAFALTNKHMGTDPTYKENMSKFMLDKYGVKEFSDLPERAFSSMMTSIQRNLDFNKSKVQDA